MELQQGNAQQSVATLQRALGCATVGLEEVHYSLGLSFRALDKLLEARAAFQDAIALDPNYAEANVALKDVRSASRAAR